ncbi:ATPase [Natronorubrum sp. DTA7]|uniref:ATPase n=1 Tax=Natronorubrum sp. DTA7 TaxID=3447016 RepID=UPI003F87729C
MSVTFDEENIEQTYHTLVRDVFEGTVRKVNSHYPDEKSVRFDWERINDFDEKTGRQSIRNPKTVRGKLEAAISAWDDVDIPRSIVRVHNIPEKHHFRVGKQRTTHLGQLVTIEGEVVEMEGVKPFAREAALGCHQCGTLNYVPQSYGKMIEPAECMGCEKSSGPFLFKRERSDLIDYRKIILQRSDTNLDDDPPTLIVYLTQDLVDRVGPGDHVSLVGYYDTGRIQKKSILETFLETWDIESHQEGVLADQLSPDELADRIFEEVEQLQNDDPSSFGADRDTVLDRLVDDGVRRQEAQSALEGLIDEKEVSEVGGDKLMTT